VVVSAKGNTEGGIKGYTKVTPQKGGRCGVEKFFVYTDRLQLLVPQNQGVG